MACGRRARPLTRAFALAAALFVLTSIGHAQAPPQNPPPAAPPTFKVEVIETTPLPGLDLKLEQIPAPVQTAVSADIEASGALDLSDFLNRRFTGVFVNEMQGNPFQPISITAATPRRRSWARLRGCRSTWTACGSISRSATS